ncbi:hypothetical protein [uncultured Clostridium sp.]|nr:hypothetical protein [uncultured Clostridium sp.]
MFNFFKKKIKSRKELSKNYIHEKINNGNTSIESMLCLDGNEAFYV